MDRAPLPSRSRSEASLLLTLLTSELDLEALIAFYQQMPEVINQMGVLSSLSQRFNLPLAVDFPSFLANYDQTYYTRRSYNYNNRSWREIILGTVTNAPQLGWDEKVRVVSQGLQLWLDREAVDHQEGRPVNSTLGAVIKMVGELINVEPTKVAAAVVLSAYYHLRPFNELSSGVQQLIFLRHSILTQLLYGKQYQAWYETLSQESRDRIDWINLEGFNTQEHLDNILDYLEGQGLLTDKFLIKLFTEISNNKRTGPVALTILAGWLEDRRRHVNIPAAVRYKLDKF